ncbi:hypothetical protein EOD41_19300 [Mucilaginibacter limnophilus]|uniref:Uncharacterized protein n=1 Tax=Mucilaginibacter limnophilus TaxID=1932778 RepID=A0A437MI43_9SPHI|nr:hypothetical protein [Mucilaginibacter limnophilus]RVT97311.1 hypothetical protein EOD41_19300 [Mucilaginibacter limnophilus]
MVKFIEGEFSNHGNVSQLIIRYPGKNVVEVKSITGGDEKHRYSHARRIIYMENRDKIVKGLLNWFKQRMYGLQKTGSKKSVDAARLKVWIGSHRHCAYTDLCRTINQNRAHIEALVPDRSSDHYEIFVNNILPLLEECALMGK